MQPDCNHYRELLWSYVTKELSDAESKKIEEHLQGCPSCRQEAEELSLIVASLSEEIPLPENFSRELHEKLVAVSEEMTTEKPTLKEKLMDGWKTLPRSRAFRTLAPALVCLVLVVGVFSSGLFDRWNNADEILTDPAPTPVSVATEEPESEPPAPSGTPKAVTPDPAESSVSAQSAPAPDPEPDPVPETPPVAPQPEPIPAEAEAEHLPAPASIEEPDSPATFALPRRRPMLVCLSVADTEEFLKGWQEVFAFDWKSAIRDVAPEELISGADPDALVLKLDRTAFDSLLEYADTHEAPKSQGETLIIFTEDEE